MNINLRPIVTTLGLFAVCLSPDAWAGTVTAETEAPSGPEVLQSCTGGTDRILLVRNVTGAKGVAHQMGGQAFTHDADFTFTAITFQMNQGPSVFGTDSTLTLYVMHADDNGGLQADPHTAINFDLEGVAVKKGHFIRFELSAEESAALGTLAAGRLHLVQLDFDNPSGDGSNVIVAFGSDNRKKPDAGDAYPGGDAVFANKPKSAPIPGQVKRMDHNFYLEGTVVAPAGGGLEPG